MIYRYLFICFVILASCEAKNNDTEIFDIQGHRGARGLAPENSLPAFIVASNLGVNTLELDVVVTKDHKLVVSHEPYFSPVFCRDSLGNEIPSDSVINIYQLNYDQVKEFDCGTLRNPSFPNQKRIAVYKPLLEEVIDSVESFNRNKKIKAINYNIELKTTSKTDSIFHPEPEVFSKLVYQVLEDKKILDRVTIQSFDFRTLKYFHENYPEVDLAILIENDLNWKLNIDSLGFTPKIYSCNYRLLSQESIKEIKSKGMKVIPWTVNDFFEMNKLIAWGVDGIITDYPDRALIIKKRK
ncbi:glycerophosphodiester phosphodiesterase family protein [Ekhidna sp. To15]|uniref:glycerophosphodiester phosphodiesterase family protein n=1 Tax=Ekhidna sp. To15 TaxID=3395267 RepID=UPI003F51ADBC